MIIEYKSRHWSSINTKSGYNLNNFLFAGSGGKSMFNLNPYHIIDYRRKHMMTNEHYKHFLRLNNRKCRHYEREFRSAGYELVQVPYELRPVNKKLGDWLNENCGEYTWTHNEYDLVAFSNSNHATLFKMTWL